VRNGAQKGDAMKKPLVLAGLSAFVLIGAAYPEAPKLNYAAAVMAGTSEVTGPTYRPCRRDRRDDRCIQLYERGVRTAYAEWLRDRGMGGPDLRVAETRERPDHVRRHRRQRVAMASVRCVDASAHHGPARHENHRVHRQRMDQGGPAEHHGHEQRREHQDQYDGEVRGM
jgi:hypothetical protein